VESGCSRDNRQFAAGLANYAFFGSRLTVAIPDFEWTAPRFPPFEITARLLLSIGAGLLIGLEREWSHKELGGRTFALTALFGAMAELISTGFALAGLVSIISLIAVISIGNALTQKPLEATTSCALLVTYSLGVLIGQGHLFTPTAAAIIVTLLLSLKPQFTRFAGELTDREVRGAVLLALIGFVIYPILPNRFIDPWGLFNPRENWLTVILIAAIGFVNYVLLRLYSVRGLLYTAFLGGLVNSTATIAELSGHVRSAGPEAPGLTVFVNSLTILAMFLRNLLVLAIFSAAAAQIALLPITLMSAAAAAYSWRSRPSGVKATGLDIGSPFEVRKIVSFGLLFIAIEVAGSLGQRLLGTAGTVSVSVLGGLVSSASATAAAATLAAHGSIGAYTAALCAILASIASTAVNLPIIFREIRDARLMRRLVLISSATGAIGIAALIAETAIRAGADAGG
jgi:uncharacterized membrane protein (DUF4010 family)